MGRKDHNDLLAELDQLGSEDQGDAASSDPKPASKKSTQQANKTSSGAEDEDVLADLQAQLAAKPSQTSRPSTPRMSSNTTSSTNKSPKRAEHTPASSGPPSGRNSEDRLRGAPAAPQRTSGEATRSYHRSYTPEASEEQPQAQQPQESQKAQAGGGSGGGGGGWWGSMFSAATAAVKQAENIAKEISGNEEAQRWAEQVKGNITHLQTFGGELRSRALPTFTSLLSHIAPPISAHERLQIHTTHDIMNYPSLDPLIYATFARTMTQVEGGDLLVLHRSSSSDPRPRADSTATEKGYRGTSVLTAATSPAGWSDGPWWREDRAQRRLNAVAGLKEGTRLARVSAETAAREFFEARGGVEAAAKAAAETLEESNPTRCSDIFLAVQAVAYTPDAQLFAGDRRAEGEKEKEGEGEEEEGEDDEVVFAVYLLDPLHSLAFPALSQPFPAKWAAWLDARASPITTENPPSSPSATSDTDANANANADKDAIPALPESVQHIIDAGGVDPREWVAEWLQDILSTAVGVVAQRYVARRMGVGEAAMGRGKGKGELGVGKGGRRVEEEAVGGEAARAV
ncbi:hypothetical protein B0A50_06308 [Salinomyces thailandicus]|uniref:Maintenance of telomere capping protein 1 n=1 Tax=Salinomyces thailandicus TaxID=706561 RepID=A0A4U0TT63_9PEZI|nr:hypothetical protein B0A50_06308 [Salinomyces thailandica]